MSFQPTGLEGRGNDLPASFYGPDIDEIDFKLGVQANPIDVFRAVLEARRRWIKKERENDWPEYAEHVDADNDAREQLTAEEVHGV